MIPDFAPLLQAALEAQQARDSYTVNTDANAKYRNNNVIVTNTTAVALGGVMLKNIFGYTELESDWTVESDGTILPLSENFPIGYTERIIDRVRQVSDEIQISGETGNLNYVTGLYFSDEQFATPAFPSLVFAQIISTNAFVFDNRTYAGYGQGTYAFGDSGFSLTAGFRYTSEKVAKSVLPNDAQRIALGEPAPPGFSYNKSRTFSNLSWTVGGQYQTDDHLFYVTSRRSYKSGGFNGSLAPRDGDASTGGDSFDEMRITDIELGWKFNGNVGDMPARADIALFYNWIDDDQRVLYTPDAPGSSSVIVVTTNVPEATLKGIEASWQINPVEILTLGATAVYTDAQFGTTPVFVVGSGNTLYDQVPDTPEFVGTMFAEITLPLNGQLDLLLHGDVFHQSSTVISPRSLENAGGLSVIDKFTVVNFRFGVENQNNGWSLIANLKNAFNKEYFVGGLPVSALYATSLLIPAEPRTFTVEARYRF